MISNDRSVPTENRRREYWIDALKGFAILLVVLGHCLGGFDRAHQFQSTSGFSNALLYIIYSFHMPLFFALSGYLYRKIWQPLGSKRFVKKYIFKLVDLAVIYFIFSLLRGLVTLHLGGDVNGKVTWANIAQIPIVPIGEMWFLYTLLIIFAIVPILDRLIHNSAIVFLILVVLYIAQACFHISSVVLASAMTYAVFFYWGCLLHNFASKLRAPRNCQWVLLVSLLLFVLTLVFYHFVNSETYITNYAIKLIAGLLGTLVSVSLFNVWENAGNYRPLCYCGSHSLQIYLLQIYFFAGTRIILSKFLPTQGGVMYVVFLVTGFVLGVGGPLVVYRIIDMSKFLKILFEPTKTISNMRKRVSS